MFRWKNRRTDVQVHDDSHSDRRVSTTSSIASLSLGGTSTGTSSQTDDDSLPGGSLGLNLLHSDPNPHVDLIFVHGLGGDSRKTWCKNRHISCFWPQEWLPKDPGFCHVRVHSYGYDSNYLKGQDNCLNIHHIGKGLLGELSTSPCLVHSKTRIVVIGHSMGGLVLKKAYILARQDEMCQTLADRFAAFYFLATPHRGADSAKLLRNILRAAHDRAYVADLGRNSSAVQVINDEFRHVSAGLELWSFYETQVMRHFTSVVVDAESAILGYREEKQIPMNADHRSICKFDSKFDGNYLLLRNALASTVHRICTSTAGSDQLAKRTQLRKLRDYLGVPDTLEDDLLGAREARLDESCQWISSKKEYIRWLDADEADVGVLWINGKPATGKSVLASSVVDDLRCSGRQCSYFFFRHGDNSKSRLHSCIRSIAFQMAELDQKARNALLLLSTEGVRLEGLDDRTLWKTLFLQGIFKETTYQHFWVLDALDECSNYAAFFSSILSHLGSVPLRILVTSRDTVNLAQRFSLVPSTRIQTFSISFADTFADLKLLIEVKSRFLPVIDRHEQAMLTENILEKSKGSFLWTLLILQELQACHTKKEIQTTLGEVPREMESLYGRILDSMSRVARGRNLTKAILMWATCATRPLTVEELRGALCIEMEDSFPRLEQSIIELCGQLVTVDKFERVQMIHETAREFLVGCTIRSEFAVVKILAHTRMAQVCLRYLAGDEMKPPRTRRRTLGVSAKKRSAFGHYAIHSFSYHIAHADAKEEDLSQLLDKVLKSNITTWIEAIAETRDLLQLIRTSRHLTAYSNACATEKSPLNPRIRILRQWCADLSRLTAKFSNALTTLPSAIHSIVPTLCPTDSMIYKLGNQYQGPRVVGVLSKEWEDRLSFIDYHHGHPTTVCHGPDFLAVGLTTGTVTLYHGEFYREHITLQHGESLKFIRFRPNSYIIATCGMKTVKLWDTQTAELLHCAETTQRPMDMTFKNSELFLAGQRNYLDVWDTDSSTTWGSRIKWRNSPDTGLERPRRCPCALAISVDHNVLAVAYTGGPITIWDLKEDAFVGYCGKLLPNGDIISHRVTSLAFNPNPNLSLLAVTYLDGDLAIVDPISNEQFECFRANCQMLAASRNGRFLAAGGSNGTINVYEFDTLKVLYTVKSSNSFIQQLDFSGNSLRIADIRGTQCNVWEPAALLRESFNDDSSGYTSASIVDNVSLAAKAKVTAIDVHPSLDIVICGNDDGAVHIYCRKAAEYLGSLYSHNSSIRHLEWCIERQSILSIDASNQIILCRILQLTTNDWTSNVEIMFKTRIASDKAVISLLIHEDGERLVVSTRGSDHFLSMENLITDHRVERDNPAMCKWITHPASPTHLIRVSSVGLSVYSWLDWSEVSFHGFPIGNHLLELKNLAPFPFGSHPGILIEFSEKYGSSVTNYLASVGIDDVSQLFNIGGTRTGEASSASNIEAHSMVNNQTGDVNELLLLPVATNLQKEIAHMIGITGVGKLVFLDRLSWVSTIDLTRGHDLRSIGMYKRHFFIPNDWFAEGRDIICALSQNEVIFARGRGIAIVKSCFEYEEDVLFENG